MDTVARTRSAGRQWPRSTLISLLLAGSLVLAACDLGGGSGSSGSGVSQPTAGQQPPAANGGGLQSGNPQTGGTGNAGGTTGGGTTGGSTGGSTTGGSTAGGSTGSSTAGPAVIPGNSTAAFGKLAAAIPVAGTDPSQQPIVMMVQKAGPAVVTVVNRGTQQGYQVEARGSGAIIDAQGYIVTNNHVVEGEQQLTVIFSDGKTQAAQLVGTSPANDLAILKVGGQMPGVIPLGDSTKLMPGEVVVAIGSALGEFRNTVTVGVVSGLHRTLAESQDVQIQDLIQTDAAINHGNSGGPLLNLDGELVGINTLGVTQAGQGDIAQGLGFAIPSKSVSLVAAQIIKGGGTASGSGGTVAGRPRLGVTIKPVDPQLAGYYNLTDPNGQLLSSGALVVAVIAGGPAQQGGVQVGDVILAVDDQQVTVDNPLGDVLTNFKPGQTVTLSVIRRGQAGTIKVTLGQAQ
ncbi:MAG TPA: trypsin-like peptidase domain-containing protein [Chloroflexia bacterium]|nr:trypsin-like peptidase domain-containing protein [Chloroflexia bacterium]